KRVSREATNGHGRRSRSRPMNGAERPGGAAAKSGGNVTEGPGALYFTSDAEANRLLAEEPLAVMLGMLLDQQVTMEWAFGAPLLLKQRLGADHLDAAAIAAMDPEELEALFRDKPALHRYPGS